ncbi:Proline-rich protein 1 [Raphanus sativus]|nr:Proline-rich protein 1 [Raphanus sativus]
MGLFQPKLYSFSLIKHDTLNPLSLLRSPPVYKPTLSPPVYTEPTLPPPIYTPPSYKPTLPPPICKKSPSYSPPTYVPKPTYTPPAKPYVSKPVHTPPTKPYVPEILKAVDGIILCKNGYETYPIQGAKAKIVCSEPGSYGNSKKDLVIYSDPTDANGYFHVALTSIKYLLHCRHQWRLATTRPMSTKSLTGVPLSMYGYRYHSDKNLKIFSVGPLYFTGHKNSPTTPKY